MDKADLIKHCRYYKGEEHCPSEAIGLFWDYERLWVEWFFEAQENENCDAAKRLDNMMREYFKAGYKDFSLYDGVPVSLKALLFNRFEHWNQSDGFKEWYMEKYISGSERKRNLIAICRYYRGESEPPADYSEIRKTIWKFESMWVSLAEKDDEFLAECIRDYVAYDLRTFEDTDGVPVSLKAFLLNRFFKHEERVDVPAFKRWYLKHYFWGCSELAQKLLNACHYYGRDFDHSDPNKEMLAFYEEWWVRRKLECPNDEERNALFANYIDEYLMAGLREFQMVDGVPITLKAVLFNRYAKNDYSLESAAAGFKEFYLKYYSDEALR